MKNMEIENKYLLSRKKAVAFLKKLKSYETHKITQIYIKIYKGNVKRIRKIDDKFIQTIKKGHGKVRKEFEKHISRKRFTKLSHKKIGKKIKKTRYVFSLDGYYFTHKFELDMFKDRLKGLSYLEIEFNNEQDMKKFVLPQQLKNLVLKNVSSDINYTNSSLVLQRKKFKNLKNIYAQIKQLNINDSFDIKTDKKACIYDSLRIYLFYYLHLVKIYLPLIFNKNNDEFLHQFRVNLRRIKSLMSIFKELFDLDIYQKINSSLRDAIIATNKKRDLDIFLVNLKNSQEKDDLTELIRFLTKEQKVEEQKFKDFIKDKKVDDIIFNLEALLCENSNFYVSRLASLPEKEYIKNTMKYLYRNTMKAVKKLDKKTKLEKFHKARIKIKKIRYLSNTFKIYSSKKQKKSLKKYQSIFGELNDLKNQVTIINHYIPQCKNKEVLKKLLNRLTKKMYLQKNIILSKQNL